jgi:succinoglycan biosynthesis protein ExoU
VAVVIAAHEAGKFIGRAVRSALAEPEVAEVFVVDDASTDDTVAATHAADDGSGRLVVLQQPANLGPGAARKQKYQQQCAEPVEKGKTHAANTQKL